MEPFQLTLGMAQNYIALQNFLSDTPDPSRLGRKGRRNGGSRCRPIGKARKLKLLEAQNFKCVDCDFVFKEKNGVYPTATRDHVIPYRYGSTLCHNSEYVCDSCNNKRNRELSYESLLKYFGTL